MAILLAFSGERFLTAIRQQGKATSLFMKVVANFLHFLLIQSLALLAALLLLAYPASNALAAIAFFLLCYGVMTAIAASVMLFNIALIFNEAGD